MTAKVSIPDNQIQACEKWEYDRSAKRLSLSWTHAKRSLYAARTTYQCERADLMVEVLNSLQLSGVLRSKPQLVFA